MDKYRNGLRCLGLVLSALMVSDGYSMDLTQMNLAELLDTKVASVSRREQTTAEAAASIRVISRETIERRGYRNLVDLLEDIPAFEFHTFEDGGGEYPVHGSVRGIGGDPGNTKLLVMIDGIIYNHVAFLWSQGWGEELLLDNVDRVEVILGPGSAIYGANAVAGIINVISREHRDSVNRASAYVGEDDVYSLSTFNQANWRQWSLAFTGKVFRQNGDDGQSRPDPAGYFSDLTHPVFLTEDYVDNQYVTGTSNPLAGDSVTDGFNTSKDIESYRLRLGFDAANAESMLEQAYVDLAYWDIEQGLGSYVVGYEYDATAPDFIRHGRQYTLDSAVNLRLTDRVEAQTRFWYRQDQQRPETGFRYLYRFPELKKRYHSQSDQMTLEQQLNAQVGKQGALNIGLQYQKAHKRDQVVSLGSVGQVNQSYTNSSWELATQAIEPQLGLRQEGLTQNEIKKSLYTVYEDQLVRGLGYSLGLRYDHSSFYGSTTNARLGLIGDMPVDRMGLPLSRWISKVIYGEAYREPTIFELSDEFRGNPRLKPESTQTYQWINQLEHLVTDGMLGLSLIELQLEAFYSQTDDSIIIDTETEHYANKGQRSSRGAEAGLRFEFAQSHALALNYHYLDGRIESASWDSIVGTARQKWLLAWQSAYFDKRLALDWTLKYSGKRAVTETNPYFDGYAPSYTKSDLALSWLFDAQGERRVQLVIDNLFDRDIVGVSRQTGSSDRNAWNPATNPNPPGFIPAYHPLPGRRLFLQTRWAF